MNRPLEDWTHRIRQQDHPATAGPKPEALDDLTVLDISSQSYAGIFCSSMLSEFGAEVIRIEPPGGDFLRRCTPYGIQHRNEGLNTLSEGRNKYHVTLDLTAPRGREIFKGLADQADVVIETFQPGFLDGLGIGYEDLKQTNPGLIFSSITASGQFGPDSRTPMPDYDNVAQARSGIQYATGIPQGQAGQKDEAWAVPTKAAPWIAWSTAGTFMAFGILSALHWRTRTGLGQALDVSTAEAYMRFDDYSHIWYQGAGHVTERAGGLDNALWLYCFSPTRDGGVFLGALRLEMWQAFCDLMGKWDEWDVAGWTALSPFLKPEVQQRYFPDVAAFTRQFTSAELVDMSVDYGRNGRLAPITPVIAPIISPKDAMADPNWVARGIFDAVPDPVYGDVVVAQAQHKMTATPIRTKWMSRPPGYDNSFIFRKYLGLGPAALAGLDGII